MHRFQSALVCGPSVTSAAVYAWLRAHSGRGAWAVAEQGINPLVQLTLTPWFLHVLGREDFGVWMFSLTLLGMSQLVSLGAGIAATKHVSADLGAGRRAGAIAAIRGALMVAVCGGALAAVLAAVLSPFLAEHLLGNLGPVRTVAPLLALCGLAAAVQEIDNVFTGAMRGAERFDLCAMVEVPARITTGAALAVLSAAAVGVRNLFVYLIIMLIIKAALKGWQVTRLFGAVSCCWPSAASGPLRRVLSFGSWQWLQSAGTIFFSAADQLLIGGLLGSAALARYSACLLIAQNVHMLPSVMTQVIFPRLSALGPSVDAQRSNEILRTSTIVTVGAALVLAIPLLALAQPLLEIWIGPRFAAENYQLLTVLIVVHLTLAFNVAPYFVLLGSGRSARSAVIVLMAGATQFVCAVLAAPLGLFVVACTRFVYSLITALLYRAAKVRVR
jgi:O-antigen/teichoic acid export membrane protein